MDGLLIDSEPLWKEAAVLLFDTFDLKLTDDQYAQTTGLRTQEFLQHWFTHFNIPNEKTTGAEEKIVADVIKLVQEKGKPMSGLEYIFNFFMDRNFKIGLASSSPTILIDIVAKQLGIQQYLQAVTSAENLAYGKPHPEVYLNCANELNAAPGECICFEDSYNGMIAVKAAKMKCIVVPSSTQSKNKAWDAADSKIATLVNFNELLLNSL